MLKKSGVVAILLLMIISFTVGSVGPIGDKNGTFTSYGYRMPGHMILPPPGLSSLAEHKYTSVILDLSGQEVVRVENGTWGHKGPMAAGQGFYPRPEFDGNKDFYAGKMIIQPAGSEPRSFSVKFFKHPSTENEKLFFISYRMDTTTFKYNDTDGANFTFGGEILVPNTNLGQSNISSVVAGDYNNAIAAGQNAWHQAQVTGAKTAFNFDLKWNNTNDDLRLTVYTPDGHILGPYTDSSDGKADGRINMEIDNTAGVADGTWIFKVADTNVTGIDQYSLRTW